MNTTDLEKITDEAGMEIFADAFMSAETSGSSEAVCYAKGYLALEDAGYSEQGGIWKKEKSILAKIKDFFKGLEHQVDEEVLQDFILKVTKNSAEDSGEDDENAACFTLGGKIVKMDSDQHLVYGWASIVEENGEPITDSHGDVIEPDELSKAAHYFVSEYRKGKVMHGGVAIGEIVESIVFSKDIQKALGINLNKIGWFIGLKVHDDEVWKQFKSGEFAMFSIGGHGEREELQT